MALNEKKNLFADGGFSVNKNKIFIQLWARREWKKKALQTLYNTNNYMIADYTAIYFYILSWNLSVFFLSSL